MLLSWHLMASFVYLQVAVKSIIASFHSNYRFAASVYPQCYHCIKYLLTFDLFYC